MYITCIGTIGVDKNLQRYKPFSMPKVAFPTYVLTVQATFQFVDFFIVYNKLNILKFSIKYT